MFGFLTRKTTVGPAIAQSMREAPQEWSVDRFRATHKSGVSLWIANGPWALGLVVGGEPSPRDGDLTPEDKRLIWAEFKPQRHKQILSLLASTAKAEAAKAADGATAQKPSASKI